MAQRSRCAARPPRSRRRQTQGPKTSPGAEATANPPIAAAPARAPPVIAATSSADCSRPQGQATHSAPVVAARQTGACTVALPPPAGGTRPRLWSQAGWRPCHSSHRPSTKAMAWSRVHNGRMAGLNCDHVASVETLAAANAPASV